MKWRMYSIEEACITDKRTTLTIFHETPTDEYFSLDINVNEVKFWGISPQDVVANAQLYVLDEEIHKLSIEPGQEKIREPFLRIRRKKLR